MSTSDPLVRRLDRKLGAITAGRYTPGDFVIADAKDADMAFGLTSAANYAVSGFVEFHDGHRIIAVAHPLHVASAAVTHVAVRAPHLETRRIRIQRLQMHAEKTRMIKRRVAAETDDGEHVAIDANTVGIRNRQGWQCRDVAFDVGDLGRRLAHSARMIHCAPFRIFAAA